MDEESTQIKNTDGVPYQKNDGGWYKTIEDVEYFEYTERNKTFWVEVQRPNETERQWLDRVSQYIDSQLLISNHGYKVPTSPADVAIFKAWGKTILKWTPVYLLACIVGTMIVGAIAGISAHLSIASFIGQSILLGLILSIPIAIVLFCAIFGIFYIVSFPFFAYMFVENDAHFGQMIAEDKARRRNGLPQRRSWDDSDM